MYYPACNVLCKIDRRCFQLSVLRLQPWDVFDEIDKEPLGAASLAQVHRAVLKDGSTVAVKVQHPKVEERSHTDVAAMEVGIFVSVEWAAE